MQYRNRLGLNERRSRRSDNRCTALRFQLEHTRSRGNIEAMVLADKDGLVVAAAGSSKVCEELGAMAPLLGRTVMGMPLSPLLNGGDVDVRSFNCHGQEFYLACLGGGMARDALVTHSIGGVRRILTAN